ncbi:hypothetical protein SAMN05660657_01677 [Geodermatophilus amargosae]|uniref:Uncharacterized protein n=1 Tax=Geodermatophilus amargosae TaxID=1296565 RepID=A0A1I6Z4L8_9ACTN|nr:hypothetical protein [Geodermatophilus amargosae]SFT57558.1 hypothetical protein SAMN05660657_01677 [Geodermatophilus amargosae]
MTRAPVAHPASEVERESPNLRGEGREHRDLTAGGARGLLRSEPSS